MRGVDVRRQRRQTIMANKNDGRRRGPTHWFVSVLSVVILPSSSTMSPLSHSDRISRIVLCWKQAKRLFVGGEGFVAKFAARENKCDTIPAVVYRQHGCEVVRLPGASHRVVSATAWLCASTPFFRTSGAAPRLSGRARRNFGMPVSPSSTVSLAPSRIERTERPECPPIDMKRSIGVQAGCKQFPT